MKKNLIDRYILGKYVKTFLMALALIVVIVITFDVSEKLDDFIKNNASLKEIVFQYYLNFIPNFFNLYSSLFIFVAVLFFTSRMASNSEIVAILSSGISFKRMLRPYLYGSLIFGLLLLVVGNFVIPKSNIQLKDFENKYIKTLKRSFYSNLHFQSTKGVQVYTESYDVNEMTTYFFHQDTYNDNNELVDKLFADKMIYDTNTHKWHALNMRHRTFDGDKETLDIYKECDMQLNLTPDDFNHAAQQITTMNSVELVKHIKKETIRGSGAVKNAKIELYQRLFNPISIIIMTFIGVAVSSHKRRGGLGIHLTVGLALAFLYIVLMRFCTVFSVNGNLSPLLAVLLPQIIFALIAIYLIRIVPK